MDAEPSHRTKGLLRLTMACNERCPFCNVPVEDYPRPTPDDDAIDRALAAFADERTVTISGGEPTLLRKRLLRVVAASRPRLVELQTNAVLIDAGYARALADAGLTSAFVSLLSDVPALHDRLAGLDGAFARCLAGIDALLDAGVRVTLNPVTAADTEARLPAYVDFVAERLPRVRSISVSAVQPHGRAARSPELLPDYAVLGPAVREARRRAKAHGIELLNPYCGLPLCVGWEDGLDVSVEAIEAREGPRGVPGVENTGDKRHGPPCRACVLRARCGGAWHAYWEVRGGSGIAPPETLRGPWHGDDAPFAWHLARSFAPGEAVAGDGLALELDHLDAASLRGVWQLLRSGPAIVWLGLRSPTAAVARESVELAAVAGIEAVVLLVDEPERWRPLAAALSARFGVDVRVG
ncbi:MAG: radical SAM protein [Myxococcota bacterium]